MVIAGRRAASLRAMHAVPVVKCVGGTAQGDRSGIVGLQKNSLKKVFFFEKYEFNSPFSKHNRMSKTPMRSERCRKSSFPQRGREAAGLYENSRVVERYAKAWIPSKICKIPKLVCDHKKLFEFC